MSTAARQPVPQSARAFFDVVRQASLRVTYMDDLVASESARVNAVRSAMGSLGEYERLAPHVLRNMERRLDSYLAEYTEATVLCDLAERIVSRVPDALAGQVLRARYLQGWDVEHIMREFCIARGTVYNAERRGMEWIDAKGLLNAPARKAAAAGIAAAECGLEA